MMAHSDTEKAGPLVLKGVSLLTNRGVGPLVHRGAAHSYKKGSPGHACTEGAVHYTLKKLAKVFAEVLREGSGSLSGMVVFTHCM